MDPLLGLHVHSILFPFADGFSGLDSFNRLHAWKKSLA